MNKIKICLKVLIKVFKNHLRNARKLAKTKIVFKLDLKNTRNPSVTGPYLVLL